MKLSRDSPSFFALMQIMENLHIEKNSLKDNLVFSTKWKIMLSLHHDARIARGLNMMEALQTGHEADWTRCDKHEGRPTRVE